MSVKTANRLIALVVNTKTDPKFNFVKLTINLDESKRHYDHVILRKDASPTAIKVFAAAKAGDYIQLDNCFFDPFLWNGKPLLTIRAADAKLVK